MKYAILSDIHGNPAALEAVLGDIAEEGVDAVICLGDTVGYGPSPGECVDAVKEFCILVLQGNHDHAAGLGLREWYKYLHITAEASLLLAEVLLSPAQTGYLAARPVSAELEGKVLVAHDNLLNPGDTKYMKGKEGLKMARTTFDILEPGYTGFFGHTHRFKIYTQAEGKVKEASPSDVYVCKPEEKVLVNAGSVGFPRDVDWRAAYVIYDTDTRETTFKRVIYDIQRTISALTGIGLLDEFIKEKFPRVQQQLEANLEKVRADFGGADTFSGMIAWRILHAQ